MRLRPIVLVGILGLAALAPSLAPGAEQARRPFRIGVLHPGFFQSIPAVEGLKVGLKAAGLEEGRDVTFDIRFTRGDLQAMPPAAAALAAAGVDVIFANSEEATRAAKAATQTIPIVFASVGDPVAAGLVKQIARPGGNVTGVSSLSTELVPKRLETLKAVFPKLHRVWAPYHADDLSSFAAVRKAQEVAPVLKLEVFPRPVRSPEELVAHLKAVRAGDGLLSPPAITMNIPGLILDLELMSRVPAVFWQTFWVKAGALMSYGTDDHADGFQAARLVAKILRGSRPQDLPVEGTNKVEFAINLKAAKSLGATIPREIIFRADQVIE